MDYTVLYIADYTTFQNYDRENLKSYKIITAHKFYPFPA
jgi:hypothetical protein